MSSFLGLMDEIPSISVDRFDEENLDSSAYFLSHCHTDHMKGLCNYFFGRLQQFNKYLYCSSLSKVFLSAHYPDTYIKELDVEKRVSVEYKNKNGDIDVLFVTCISAGHCPGSVMFLFEKADKVILYTGDFRIDSTDFTNIKPLHFVSGSVSLPKKLTKVYLDTTFLDPEFAIFPTRSESRSKIYKVIEDWLVKSPKNVVILECSAKYGPEYLFIELSEYFKKSIHVKSDVYSSYCRIPNLKPYITIDKYATPIHACMSKHLGKRSGLECRPDVLPENILTIIPSAMRWRGKDTGVIGAWDDTRENTYNICYSMHCSFEELKAFIQYFKPEDIFPCVLPRKPKQNIHKLLEEIKKTSKREGKAIVKNNKKYTLKILKHKDR